MSNKHIVDTFNSLPLRERAKLLNELCQSTMQEAFQSPADEYYDDAANGLHKFISNLNERVFKVTKPLFLVGDDRLYRNYRYSEKEPYSANPFKEMLTEWEQIKNSKFEEVNTDNEKAQKILDSLDVNMNAAGYHATNLIAIISNELKGSKERQPSDSIMLSISQFVHYMKSIGSSANQAYKLACDLFFINEGKVKESYSYYKNLYPEYIELPDNNSSEMMRFRLILLKDICFNKQHTTIQKPTDVKSFNTTLYLYEDFLREQLMLIRENAAKKFESATQKYGAAFTPNAVCLDWFSQNFANPQEAVCNIPQEVRNNIQIFLTDFANIYSGKLDRILTGLDSEFLETAS